MVTTAGKKRDIQSQLSMLIRHIAGGQTTIGNARGGGDNAASGPGTATATTASTFDATNVTSLTTKTFDEAKWQNKQ